MTDYLCKQSLNTFKNKQVLQTSIFKKQILPLLKLLRWDKPSGRLILFIPAGWALWLTPSSPPSIELFALIFTGTLFISGAGCIANDLWDKNFDKRVKRTKTRPLANGSVKVSIAWFLLCLMLCLSLLIVLLLPSESRSICLRLSIIVLPIIIIYPSAKRWFKYPQAILSICWGFAVLIPWAASQSNLNISLPLLCCWLGTMLWTFGFDTAYAMSDKRDDANLGLNSSALSFEGNVITPISLSYAAAAILLALGAFYADTKLIFWPFWFIASYGMQKEVWHLKKGSKNFYINYGTHFTNQVRLGALILLGLVISKI